MKVKLRADLSPEVLVKLREILIRHKIEWEEEVIGEKSNGQERRFVEKRKGSYEI